MICQPCTVAREYVWHGRLFDSVKCVYCAARLIQLLGTLPIGRTECARRRRAVLNDSVAAGLDEALIRALAKGPMAVEPEQKKPKKKRGTQ